MARAWLAGSFGRERVVQLSMPRSASSSSTLRDDNEDLTSIIATHAAPQPLGKGTSPSFGVAPDPGCERCDTLSRNPTAMATVLQEVGASGIDDL